MGKTNELHKLLNRERRKRGLSLAKWDQDLWKGCKTHSNHMARLHKIFHAHWGIPSGGECVCGGRGTHSPRSLTKSWMHSPGHATLILNPHITRQAVAISSNKYGTYATWRGKRYFHGIPTTRLWNSYVNLIWLVIFITIIVLLATRC